MSLKKFSPRKKSGRFNFIRLGVSLLMLMVGLAACSGSSPAGRSANPRPYAEGSIAETFQKWPQIGPLLPAMGYSAEQVRELEAAINRTPADLVVLGTPIDLRRFMTLNKPAVRVFYELEEIHPQLEAILQGVLPRSGK